MAWLEKKSGVYYACSRDGNGRRRRQRLCRDKSAALVMLGDLMRAEERGEAGLTDPYKAHRNTHLSDHLRDYLDDLKTKGRDDMYRLITDKRLTLLFTDLGWKVLRDVEPGAFMKWRSSQDGKRTAATCNQFLETLRAMMRWCVKVNRLKTDPTAPIEKMNESITREKRALTADEAKRLLDTAPPQRSIVYATAIYTGLRRQELADLRWGDVKLLATVPSIKLRAAATKARRADVLALRPELAERLRTWKAEAGDVDDRTPVFPRGTPAMATFRKDLAEAGIDDGLDTDGSPVADKPVVVFHSLRKTLNTWLLEADVSAAVGMKTMRLTDRKLYDHTYADKAVFDSAAALAKLPGVMSKNPKDDISNPHRVQATGTDDHHPGDVREKARGANRGAPPVISGRLLTPCGTLEGVGSNKKTPVNTGANRAISGASRRPSKNWETRIRT